MLNNGKVKNLVFCYGTLKRGFPNYGVMQEIGANFVSDAKTKYNFPMVIDGEWSVPFMIDEQNFPNSHQVLGELFEVDQHGVMALDDFEGVGMDYYKRLEIEVICNTRDEVPITKSAWCYFRYDKSEELLSDPNHFLSNYGKKEAAIYTEVQERPPDWRNN